MGRKPKTECLTLYPEVDAVAEKLTDKQLGALVRALFGYRFRGECQDFGQDVLLCVVFEILKNQVDRMEDVKKRNQENARRRWEQAERPTPAVPGIPAKSCIPATAGVLLEVDEEEKNFPF